MIGFIVVAIIAVLLIGLVFKLAKVAIVLALVVGAVVVVRNFIGKKRLK